jgi:ATP-binding cassette subfamily B protein
MTAETEVAGQGQEQVPQESETQSGDTSDAAAPPAAEPPKPAGDPLFGSGIKYQSGWARHEFEYEQMTLRAVARRLPGLIAVCVRLSWRADRPAVLTVLACQTATGLATAFGLLAANRVLISLLAAGPTPGRVRAALPALLLVALASGGGALLGALANAASGRLRPRVSRFAYGELLEHATRVELLTFQQSDFHDLLDAAQYGAGWAEYMVEELASVATAIAGLAAAAGVLTVLNPLLLPLLVLAALPDGAATVVSNRRRNLSRVQWLERLRQQRRLTDLMTDKIPAEEVRQHDAGTFLLRHYARLADAFEREQARLARADAITGLKSRSVTGVATGATYLLLGVLLWRGTVPLATAGTAVLAIRTGTGQLGTLVKALNQVFEYGLYLTDWQDAIARAQRERIPETGVRQEQPPTVIRTENLGFTYPNSRAPALTGVDLEIHAGEIVALVGENGSGKTTLAKLLTGLYLPGEGRVLWDGTSTADLARAHAATHTAVLSQDFPHWPFTVRANIAIGRHLAEPDEDRLAAAAELGGARAVIDGLDAGLDTLIANEFLGGVGLSGGQWQKIALARAYYRDAPILVLDEPTASLDPRAEMDTFQTVLDRAAGRTVILVTHRLHSVRHADRIVVLDHGRVIEHGDHAQLMALGGRYAELFALQAGAFG